VIKDLPSSSGGTQFLYSDIVFLNKPIDTAITPQNGWSALVTSTAKKSKEGLVNLEGQFQKMGSNSGVLFTLPTGLRPTIAKSINIGVNYSGVLVTDQLAIATNGEASLMAFQTGTTTSVIVYLDGINFYVK
jgi:hypothetical protein